MLAAEGSIVSDLAVLDARVIETHRHKRLFLCSRRLLAAAGNSPAETNTLLPLPLLLLLLDTRTVDNTTIINAHMNIAHR